ncbi:MAG TPA: hypothetical protein VHV79_07400 [Mycobacteriales bacterium]|nr:hypothetical protein [Mycobacteriales bacterium]
MPAPSRYRRSVARRLAVAAGAIAVAASSAVALAPPATSAPAHPAAVARPGPVGSAFAIAQHVSLTGQSGDIAMASNGTAYLGWISASIDNSNDRLVHLCVLPLGARTCKGGVQTIDSGDPSTAADLFVLAPPGGKITFVWYHDTASSGTNPHAAQIAEATVTNNVLSPPTDVASGPSHGELLDAVVGPGGTIWTVAYDGSGTSLELRAGVTNDPVQVKTPFEIGFAHLAFARSTPILAVTESSLITQPPWYSYRPGSSWKAFRKVPGGAWSSGRDIGLTATSAGVRLITGDGRTNIYASVVSRWTGSAFAPIHSTGDTTEVSSHDDVTDHSGRLVNLSQENSQFAVANLADTVHAATFRFSTHGTTAGFDAQVGSTPRGHGVAMWAVETTSGYRILVQPFRLAGLHKSVTKHGKHGSVTLVGPASCLPASSLSVSVKGHGKHGWKAHSHKITLGGKHVGSSLNGASLRAGKAYKLKGSVVFSHGHAHSTVAATLKFKTCPNP